MADFKDFFTRAASRADRTRRYGRAKNASIRKLRKAIKKIAAVLLSRGPFFRGFPKATIALNLNGYRRMIFVEAHNRWRRKTASNI